MKTLKGILDKKIQEVENQFKDKSIIKKIGTEVKDRVLKRTKAGYGVDANGADKKALKPLSGAYKDARKKGLRRILAGDAKPSKSNLTLTGKMLRSLKVFVSGTTFTIKPATKAGKDKANWQADQGRKFLYASKLDIKYLRDRIRNILRAALRK